MKVRELIEALKEHPPDMDVHIGYPSGDYWRTQLAAEIDELTYRRVKWTDYHNNFAVEKEKDHGEDNEDDDEDVHPDKAVKEVLVIQ